MLHNSFVTYILAWIKSLFFSSFHFILFTLSGVELLEILIAGG
jgi:hypothetical protein